jgi:tRNA-specific 2-thiouridylase
MCNREIKFGVFLDYAKENGFSHVATGHYARTVEANGHTELHEGLDPNKDQSYFLALMNQQQVNSALFPIGDLLKDRVRELAREFDLPNAAKKDSQGICFIGQVKMSDFLSAYVPENPGPIVDLDGNILGNHRGLHYYTLGQRRGIGIATTEYKKNYVVVAKEGGENQLVVALEENDTPRLFSTKCIINNLSFVDEPLGDSHEILARPRYRTIKCSARFERLSEDRAELEFSVPQRALTPGQICALHDGTRLIGGGVFESIKS